MIVYFDINTEQICKFFFNLSANYKSYYLHNYLKDYIKYQKQQNTRNMKDVWKYLYWSVHDSICKYEFTFYNHYLISLPTTYVL